jgi:hypothetical protein
MMKKKVAEIINDSYGEYNVSCEPSNEEIEKAIREEDFETGAFQDDLDKLKAEWEKARNFQEYCDSVKKYHIRRIAFFVVNKWKDPIVLNKDECTVKDGLHRLKAAIYSGMETVDVIMLSDPP